MVAFLCGYFSLANQADHEACNKDTKLLGIGQTGRNRREVVDLSVRGENVKIRLLDNKQVEPAQRSAVLVLQSRDAQARMPHDTEASWVGFVTIVEDECLGVGCVSLGKI